MSIQCHTSGVVLMTGFVLLTSVALHAGSARQPTLPQALTYEGCYYVRAGEPVQIPGRSAAVGAVNGRRVHASADAARHLLVELTSGLAQPYEVLPPEAIPPQARNIPQLGPAPTSSIGRNVPQVPLRDCAPASPLLRDVPQVPPAGLNAPAVDTSVASRARGRAPATGGGFWIEYAGTLWVPAGSAVPFASREYRLVGEYREFPVYRRRDGGDRIYLPVSGGKVAPWVAAPPEVRDRLR